ncbi:hypothetical protein GS528_16335 [Rhodococcus hoagii]|nr:hypothetical protein [Prescottella equi]
MLDCRGPASAVVVEQLVGAAVSVAREAPVGDVSAPLPRVGLCGNETLRPDGREDAAVTVQVCLEVDSVGVAVRLLGDGCGDDDGLLDQIGCP